MIFINKLIHFRGYGPLAIPAMTLTFQGLMPRSFQKSIGWGHGGDGGTPGRRMRDMYDMCYGQKLAF